MVVQWPRLLPEWVTPELVLDGWRERIKRVAAEEGAYLASLPYVRGVALIGSVGRRTQWPLSDVDFLVAADFWEGQDPEGFIRSEEAQRNQQLHAARIPNDIEAGNWVVLARDLAAAADDENVFLKSAIHPHWLGLMIKAPGGRLVGEPRAKVAGFLDQCNRLVSGDRFVQIWLAHDVDRSSKLMGSAAHLVARGDWSEASAEIIRATQSMMRAFYATWRKLPCSLSRGVGRFLTAADAMNEPATGHCLLTAARLNPSDISQRFAAVPPSGQHERDVWLAVRQGAGEDTDRVSATRDLLHLYSRLALESTKTGPYPPWTGVAGAETIVRTQFEAAKELLSSLRSAVDGVAR